MEFFTEFGKTQPPLITIRYKRMFLIVVNYFWSGNFRWLSLLLKA